MLIDMIASRADELRATMLRRTTQTNEPARCAVLLPLLAALPQPLALIEVGASAGLCLLPDRYGYDWGHARIAPARSRRACFQLCSDRSRIAACRSRRASSGAPASISIRSMSRSDEDTAWLNALIWPEQDERRRNLQAALATARREPPRVVRGDLLATWRP